MFNETTFVNTYNQFTPDIFRDPLFGDLKVFIDKQNQCWFVGSEVASKLGYSNPWKAIIDHVTSDLKQEVPNETLGTLGGNPTIVLIHELGLYALCMRSHLARAKEFQKFVYNSIQQMRMYGISMSPQLKTVLEIDEEQAYRAAQQKINELQNQNNKLQGQVDLLNSVKPSVFHPLTQDERIELEELRELKSSLGVLKRYI